MRHSNWLASLIPLTTVQECFEPPAAVAEPRDTVRDESVPAEPRVLDDPCQLQDHNTVETGLTLETLPAEAFQSHMELPSGELTQLEQLSSRMGLTCLW